MTTSLEQRLMVHAGPGGFGESEVAGVDEPVRRYFCAAIGSGTPLARAPRLHIPHPRLDQARQPMGAFRADELLAPLHGYYWPAKVAGGLLRGSDEYVDGTASML